MTDQGPLAADPETDRRHSAWEAYWRAHRRHVRRRYAAAMAGVIAPVGLLVVAFRLLAPPDYPPGDIRNELAFRLALAAFFVVILATVAIGSVRSMLRDRAPQPPDG